MPLARAQRWMTQATAHGAGAVAIIQIHGDSLDELLTELAGKPIHADGSMRFARLAAIDEGVVVVARGGAWAQVMPHGGPMVVRHLIDWLGRRGVSYESTTTADARRLYPEASCELEAKACHAAAWAASPRAVSLLASQTALWREAMSDPEAIDTAALLATGDPLTALLTPPTVVVVGRPNTGKSTLTNRVLGRAASLVSDLPGTTRDWVGGLAEIGGREPFDAVAVRWLDTPGLRPDADSVERRAIALALDLAATAGVLIAMRSPEIDWPDLSLLPRRPDVWVVNKMEKGVLAPSPARDHELHISARDGAGIAELERRVLAALRLPFDAPTPTLWAFDPSLRDAVSRHDWRAVRAMLAP